MPVIIMMVTPRPIVKLSMHVFVMLSCMNVAVIVMMVSAGTVMELFMKSIMNMTIIVIMELFIQLRMYMAIIIMGVSSRTIMKLLMCLLIVTVIGPRLFLLH